MISKQGTALGSYAWGHILHFQTFGSPSGFLHLWTHLGFPDTGQWRVSVHAQQQGQKTHEFPQVCLDSDRQENTSGETWILGHVKSRLAQSSQQRKLVASEVKDRHGSLSSFPYTFYLRANWHLHLLWTGMQNLCCFWTVLPSERETQGMEQLPVPVGLPEITQT